MIITVIVCCHNSEDRLSWCLEKIDNALSSLSCISAEVIVVDNASTDNTNSIALTLFRSLSGASYRLVEAPMTGLMHARYAGIRAALGDVICFLDDDNWVTPEYFKAVTATFKSKANVGFFGCSTKLPDDRSFPQEITQFAKSYAVGNLYPTSGIIPLGDVVWGAGFAARTSTLKLIVNSEFQPILLGRIGFVQLAGDDSELGHALTITGWRGWYQCEPLIEHAIDIQRMNSKKLEAMYRGFGASISVIYRYSLYSRNCKKVTLKLFWLWFLLRLSKNLFILFLGRISFHENLRARLLWISYIEAFRYFYANRNIRAIQRKNYYVLSEIRNKLDFSDLKDLC